MTETLSMRILKASVEGIDLIESEGKNLDNFLDDLIDCPDIRPSVSSILFSYYRNKSFIDALLDSKAEKLKPKLRRILGICVTEVLFQYGIQGESAVNITVDYAKKRYGAATAGFINAVMHKIMEKSLEEHKQDFPENKTPPLPQIIHSRWRKTYGPEVISAMNRLLKKEAPFVFRRTGRLSSQDLADLDAEKLSLPDWAEPFDFYKASPQKLFEKHFLAGNRIYIQDPATVSPISFVESDTDAPVVLDICAAPGGKSICMAEKFKNIRLTAVDKSAARKITMIENFTRFGVNAGVVTASAFEVPFKPETFDIVLADVPCSNTGVFRRRPDVLWHFSLKKLAELVSVQSEILRKSAELLKPGGLLVYSTCSIEQDENQKQIADFLKTHDNFKLKKERLLIPDELHDGSYAAALLKN